MVACCYNDDDGSLPEGRFIGFMPLGITIIANIYSTTSDRFIINTNCQHFKNVGISFF